MSTLQDAEILRIAAEHEAHESDITIRGEGAVLAFARSVLASNRPTDGDAMTTTAIIWPQVRSRAGEAPRRSHEGLPVRGAKPPTSLQARAEFLWPNDPVLAAKWVRAVGVVRSTTGGWIIDHGNKNAVGRHA